MHIEGTTNHHDIFEPTYYEVETTEGERISFQPTEKMRTFAHHLTDLPHHERIATYRLASGDGTVAYYYIVHPGMQAIIVPPNAIEIEYHRRDKGVSEAIQKFFEMLAHKQGYRLLVGIVPQSLFGFNQRVIDILRKVGYYMGPPSEKSEVYFGEHQSTYTGNGISEIGTGPEYMMSPTIG